MRTRLMEMVMKKVVTMRTSWGSNLVSGARQGSERRFLSKLLGQDPTLNLGQDPTLNSPLINYHLPHLPGLPNVHRHYPMSRLHARSRPT